jgi:hypothetical protein
MTGWKYQAGRPLDERMLEWMTNADHCHHGAWVAYVDERAVIGKLRAARGRAHADGRPDQPVTYVMPAAA